MKDTQQSSGDSQQTQCSEDDDDDVVGCLPRALSAGHREIIETVVQSLPEVIASGKEDVIENDFARYARLLDIYQEQPNLLDCVIPSLLKKFESYVTLPSSASPDKRLDKLSVSALRYIAHLTKVRGFKVIVRLLSHHVSYLDKLLTALEQYNTSVGSDLYERHVLLLWLWIVCKNPFDFRRFDPIDQPGSTANRILSVATSYLKYPWARTHPAAVLVIAECLARLDCIPLIPSIISECIEHLSSNSENLLSYAVLVCAILKHVDRIHLLPHVFSLKEAVIGHFPLKKSSKDILTRKVFIKLVQRLALVVLKPRLAAWRYKRGRRLLEENLKEPKSLGNGVGTPHHSGNCEMGADEICVEEEDDGEHPDEVVEWAIGCVLCALSDDHTMVRWSAAKGVGRITARLPRDFAVQVVDSILSSNFHRLAGHCSWHGGCLALAELSRRGILLPQSLEKAFSIAQQALFYEEPMGRHAFGSNVRDAACYVLWAFARAYEPDELKCFVDSVATSLMCVALFDREVNLRRAASAAFQENVGRQANFPDGIALLTIVDYFVVGNRWRCYNKACLEVVRFPKYSDALVDHLIENKVIHWDEVIREQAASALGFLAPFHADYVLKKLPDLYDGCCSTNPVHRHGYILALSNTIQGLVSVGRKCDQVLQQAVELPWKLRAESEKLKVSGGELTRRALAAFIRCMSSIPIDLDVENIERWLDRLLVLACDNTAAIRNEAAAAAAAFFPAYFVKSVSSIADAKVNDIPSKITRARNENERVGLCSVVGFLPPRFIDSNLFESVCDVIVTRRGIDVKWALARSSALDALGCIFTVRPREDWTSSVFDALFHAIEDYTTDSHGDIGRFVRMSAMSVMTKILNLPTLNDTVIRQHTQRVVQHMVQQSVGTIGRVRETACKCIKTLLNSSTTGPFISHIDEMSEIYRNEHDFIQDSIFLSITPLLLHEEYYNDLICGLVISAGGVSEGTTMRASQALMEYQVSISKDIKLMERFLSTVADIFDVGKKIPRIGECVLRLLPQILSRLHILEKSPDTSIALSRLVLQMTKIINARVPSPVRIKTALNALCSLLGCERSSQTWRAAMQLVVRSLSNPMPVIRRAAAEGLYENVCLTDVDEQILILLSETVWQETSPAGLKSIHESAQSIERMLLTEESVVKTLL